MTKYLIPFLLLLLLSSFYGRPGGEEQKNRLTSIPRQTLDLDSLAGYVSKGELYVIPQFEISELVTLGEYKSYLHEVKKDSSYTFYLSQLPQTAFLKTEIFREYISNPVYESWPVLGVSWVNAMNYCKWLTIKNNSDTIDSFYRLPTTSEWLSARNSIGNAISHDYSQNYAEWLINSYDETHYSFTDTLNKAYDYCYFANQDDPKVFKRKMVIGRSYHFQPPATLPHSFSYYQFEGYRYVGFRYVKESPSRTPAFLMGTQPALLPTPLAEQILRGNK